MIKCLVPDMPSAEQLLPWLQRMDRTRWYTNFGPLLTEFEGGLAAMVFARDNDPEPVHVCATGSGTAALELALTALALEPGSRVVIPALTFPATATAVLRCGLQPVLADVDPHHWMLSPAQACAIAEDCGARALMPVAAYGHPLPVDRWDAVVEDAGLPVIIDAAGAFPDQAAGRKCIVATSFHATKALGIGEGGALYGRNELFMARVRRLADFGMHKGQVTQPGLNAKLSEYHAAVGLAQLQRWDENRRRRATIAEEYCEILRSLVPEAVLQAETRSSAPAQQLVYLSRAAHAVGAALAAKGIETRRWYCPILTYHPAVVARSLVPEPLPVSEALSERLLGLPMHNFLTTTDILEICQQLQIAVRGGERAHELYG